MFLTPCGVNNSVSLAHISLIDDTQLIHDKTHSLNDLSEICIDVTFVDKMAQFDLKLTNSLVPDFDGEAKHVTDFLDKAEFYHNTLNADARTTFIDFLLKVKLLAKVKTKFIVGTTPTTLQ